ncbi:hypothetical protein Lalb_Chr18g0054041 [Lupinus albus]|uniref:Uncharacterized protein n=1 Tax=Lupinus albus TaxID=3870 RepID=A0A6A4NZ74_LUPAL|nr:hypothetical protein Lalb_Chr18g0054041 [Lupinus albus]
MYSYTTTLWKEPFYVMQCSNKNLKLYLKSLYCYAIQAWTVHGFSIPSLSINDGGFGTNIP